MPKLNKTFTLEITIEQFLNACSPLELQELDMQIQSHRYQQRMKNIKSVEELQEVAPWIKELGVGNINLNPYFDYGNGYPERDQIKAKEESKIREAVILRIRNIIGREVDPEKINLVTLANETIEDQDWKRVAYDGEILFAVKVTFDKKGFLWKGEFREVQP